jgi:hypothetical protein
MVVRQTSFCSINNARGKYANSSPESAALKSQRPIAADDEHRVLQFRPRAPAHPHRLRSETAAPPRPERTTPEPLDLSRYERAREEPDDFRHRMLANIAAFAFTVALTAIGIWLAISIADMRKTQDCVLMGRRDCARITTQQY